MTDINEGEITLAGVDQSEDVLEIKKNVSYSPEEDFLLSELTVEQHFQLFIDSYQLYPETAREKINRYINVFEIADKLDQYPESLSKGMRAKVQIICALLDRKSVV